MGRNFLDDCDGRIVVLDADEGVCILDPDADTRQQMVSRICAGQREEEGDLETPVQDMPCCTRDGTPFELLANCFGPEDIDSAIQSGAAGVGLLRSDYQILGGGYLRRTGTVLLLYGLHRCAPAASPSPVRTFDFGSDRTLSNIYRGDQSAHLGMRGIPKQPAEPPQLLKTRSGPCCGPAPGGRCGLCSPWSPTWRTWDEAMKLVAHCRQNLDEAGCALQERRPLRHHAQHPGGLPDGG